MSSRLEEPKMRETKSDENRSWITIVETRRRILSVIPWVHHERKALAMNVSHDGGRERTSLQVYLVV